MKLRFLNGHFQGRVMDLKPGDFTIGRGPENSLAIDAEGISRRHCLITSKEGVFYIEDLQSTNGVRLNGRRIEAREAISAGDHLGLGPFVLQVIEMEEPAAPLPEPGKVAVPPAVAAESPSPAKPAAEVLEKAPFPWGRTAVIGLLAAAIGYLLFITLRTPPPTPVQTGAAAAAVMPGAAKAAAPAAMAGGAPIPGVVSPAPDAGRTDAEAVAPAAAEEGAKADPAEAAEPAVPAAVRPAAGIATCLLVVASEPAGATLKLDGVEKGITPVTLPQVPNGRHTVSLTHIGYDEFVRQIHLPFVAPDKPYVLRQKPGTLFVTSTPSGATVRYGPRILGMTPVLIDDLPDGDHELRVTALGYDIAKVKATISPLRPETRQVALQSLMGDVEVVTYPIGCDVYVDETLLGRSKAGSGDARESLPLLVRNLLEGEHEVRIQHPLGAMARTRVAVVKHEVRRASLRLFVVDTEITLTDGAHRYGMLIEKNPLGDVILAESSKRLERYLKPQVAQITPVTAERAKELLDKLRVGELKADKGASAVEKVAETTPLPIAPRSGGAETAEAKPELEKKTGGKPGVEVPPEGEVASAEKLVAMARGASATELKQKFRGKVLSIIGIPSMSGTRDANNAYVTFGSKVRFEFSRQVYDTIKDQVKTARESRTPLTIHGTVADYTAEGFILRECTLQDAAEKQAPEN